MINIKNSIKNNFLDEIIFLSDFIFIFTSLGIQKLSMEYIKLKNPNIKNKLSGLKNSLSILTSLEYKLYEQIFPNTNKIENNILIYNINLYCLLYFKLFI